MTRPIESDFASHVAYTRALEAYCDSLNERLAQPEQKPYGYVRADGEGIFIYGEHQFKPETGVELIPVYTRKKS